MQALQPEARIGTERRRRAGALLLATVYLLSAGMAALPACTIVHVRAGDELPADRLESLTAGVSTQADVIREIGPPTDVGNLMKGSVFVYRLTEGSAQALEIGFAAAIAGYQNERRTYWALVVVFDREGVVSGWGLSSPDKG